MSYVTYILRRAKTKRYYTGQTSNLHARIRRHNEKRVSSTKNGTPWELVYFQEFKTQEEAVFLEKKIKGRGAGRYLKDIGV